MCESGISSGCQAKCPCVFSNISNSALDLNAWLVEFNGMGKGGKTSRRLGESEAASVPCLSLPSGMISLSLGRGSHFVHTPPYHGCHLL